MRRALRERFRRNRSQASGETGEVTRSSDQAPAVASGADVFICYSRDDREFVERLHAGLGEGLDVYVDWEDIPTWSPDYQSELEGAIDGCDAFVFVLSPDSLASPHCKLELDRAVEQGKRIRPVLRRDVGGAAVPEPLRRPQWSDFSRDEAFAAELSKLVDALGVDADWVRRHTRIGLRANEWDREGRDASFLLRGSDLRAAEAWFADQKGKEPPPSPLQTEYVLAARGAATRRQRLVLALVGTGLAVALGLAVVALLQRNDAVDQRREADAQRAAAIAQRDRAISLAVATSANEQVDKRVDLALLLGLEAKPQRPEAQAKSAMIRALETARRSGIVGVFRGHAGAVYDVELSPDGHTLASASEDGTVRFWNLRSHARVGKPLHHAAGVHDVDFSPDGRTIGSAAEDGAVQLWDARTYRRLGPPLRPSGSPPAYAVAFSRDGRTLASAGEDGALRLWSVGARRQIGRLLRGGPPILAVAFSPDGHTLAVGGEGELVRLWDLRMRRQLDPIRVRDVVAVAFAPNGRIVATGNNLGAIHLWNGRTQSQRGPTLRCGDSSITSVAFSPDGRTLAAACGGTQTFQLWDARTYRTLGRPLRIDGPALTATFSRDGRTLASNGDGSTVRLWDVRRDFQFGQRLVGTTDDYVWGPALFSPSGRTLAVSEGESVELWDARTRRRVLRPLRHGAAVHDFVFSPTGHMLASTGEDRAVRLWDVRSGRELRPPLLRPSNASSVGFSRDGSTLASAGGRTVLLWDVQTHEPLGLRWRFDAIASASAFSRDGRAFAVADATMTVRLWDVRTRRPLGPPLRGHNGEVLTLAFSPDGHLLASGGDDMTVQLWDVSPPRRRGLPLRLGDRVLSVAFSPDGRLLATGSGEGLVRLWDVRTHQELGDPLRGDPQSVESVAFSPDGRTLVSRGYEGAVRLWEGILWHDLADLRRQVCRLVVGNLTTVEWAELTPGVRPHATCPA